MITIIGCNKGGAGKTTTSVNVAVALAKTGADVCLVDADPQRTASRWNAEREASGRTPSITLIEKRDNISSTLKALNEKFDHVLVDVPGRNSRELITGSTVADLIIAPHQCSQFDLDTLVELQEQMVKIRDLNPELRVLVYQCMSSTNPAVKEKERQEFVDYLEEFPEFEVLESIGFYRKVYRDSSSIGQSVIETSNASATEEIESLVKEVFGNA